VVNKPVVEQIVWVNQNLVKQGSQQQQHCFNQTKVDCSKRTITEQVPKQVPGSTSIEHKF
jgi:hypothetical protein